MTNREKSAPPSPPRRGFLRKIWWALGGVILAEAGLVASDFFGPRRRDKRPTEDPTLVVAGPVDRFSPGSVTPFPQGKFYLARLEDGGFLALSRKCTHLGCTVPWIQSEGRFLCPCHASAFNIQGKVLSPPAPRPLDLFSVRIENSIVKVDIREPVERTTFSRDQVART